MEGLSGKLAWPVLFFYEVFCALNRVLIPAQVCRGKMVQNRTGIMDLQNKSNILVANNGKLEIRSQCKVLCFEKCFKSCFDTGTGM